MTLRPIIKIWFIISSLGYFPIFIGLVAWDLLTDPWLASDGCVLQQSEETLKTIIISNLSIWLLWAAICLVASVVGLWCWSRFTGNSFRLTHHSSGTPSGAP